MVVVPSIFEMTLLGKLLLWPKWIFLGTLVVLEEILNFLEQWELGLAWHSHLLAAGGCHCSVATAVASWTKLLEDSTA